MIKKKIDQKILRSLLFIDADSAWFLLFIRLCLIDLALKKVKFSCLFVFFVFYFVKSDQRSFHYFCFQISSFSVITQKGESQNECFKKTKNAKFSEKRTFLTTWYAHVRTCAYLGVRNVRFSENLAWFVFLKHPFWHLPFCLITEEQLFIWHSRTLV